MAFLEELEDSHLDLTSIGLHYRCTFELATIVVVIAVGGRGICQGSGVGCSVSVRSCWMVVWI